MFEIGDIVKSNTDTYIICRKHGLANIVSLTSGNIILEFNTIENLNSLLRGLKYIKIGKMPITFTENKE